MNDSRSQIDFLRNPDAMRGIESKAAERIQTVQHQANAIRESNLADIERHYRPSKTVTDVVAEWAAKPVEK